MSFAQAASAQDATRAPAFVGCKAIAMDGSVPAPTSARLPRVSAAAADKLAYYASNGIGVLAPRGWRCIELSGSNGSYLLVTPESHSADELMRFPSLSGPAIQVAYLTGDTSGRFEVAKLYARLFPAKRAFVRSVIDEGLEPEASFPFGPGPDDTLVRKGSSTVGFITSAGRLGIGTNTSRLGPGSEPVQGFATLVPDNDVLVAYVRLPSELRDFTPDILRLQRDDLLLRR